MNLNENYSSSNNQFDLFFVIFESNIIDR